MTNAIVKHAPCPVLAEKPDAVDRLNARLSEYQELGHYLNHMALTPDDFYMAETHSNSIFATTAQAQRATRRDGVMVGAGLAMILLAFGLGGTAGEAYGGVAALITGLLVLAAGFAGVKYATAFMRAESFPVSNAMLAAWTLARPVLELSDEENTVPAILAELQSFEAEARTIYSTYASLVSPVDREQVELDFMTVCGVIEVLGQEATNARYELYSTRRSQYLP